jgi:hypothetical protein
MCWTPAKHREDFMQEMTVREDIPLAADAAWAVIGDFSGIRKWATLVEAESTEVTPQGKVRTLTMPGGRTVSELMTDEGPHHYTYTLDRPDMEAYFSTVSVEPGNGESCAIVLRVRFQPRDPAQLEAATEAMGKFCRGNLKAMKRALGLA